MRECSVDSAVTDPPYGLSFMGKEWDHGLPSVPFWRQVIRVLRPGAYLLAFGGTRTFHRLACAIEDAGFEIRDCVMWVYGTGFPKSLDVSKAIDKAAGAKREAIGAGPFASRRVHSGGGRTTRDFDHDGQTLTAPATDAAKQWDGWGTALKPAWEPIIVARKPLDGTVAANVLEHGTGALNIDATRVPTSLDYVGNNYGDSTVCTYCGRKVYRASRTKDTHNPVSSASEHDQRSGLPSNEYAHAPDDLGSLDSSVDYRASDHYDDERIRDAEVDDQVVSQQQDDVDTLRIRRAKVERNRVDLSKPCEHCTTPDIENKGRWPANLIHDGSDEVAELFPQTTSGKLSPENNVKASTGWSGGSYADRVKSTFLPSSGSAARFFYCAKASRKERDLGLESQPVLSGGELTNRKDGSPGTKSPRAGAGRTSGGRNIHPTVKPVALMRYLCRLVTRPGGLILDPFMGSGSTGVAAKLEGFSFVGVEIDEDYCKIARKRIRFARAEESAAAHSQKGTRKK